jgi:hypothetical protein
MDICLRLQQYGRKIVRGLRKKDGLLLRKESERPGRPMVVYGVVDSS